MKYILIFILSLFCGLHLAVSHAADMEEQTKNPNREIKAGIFNFEGYHSKDDNGKLFGYGIDLLSLLSEYSHLNFLFSGYDESWLNMQKMLKDGDIDIVSTARRTPEREEVFAFSLPVGRNQTILAKQIFNSRLKAGDYSTYDGMKIGVVKGSSQNRHLKDFATDKGFSYTVVEFDSPVELAQALQNGEVDSILSSNLRKPENETILDIVKSDNFYIIARKEDQDIIDEINYAIEQMNLNEGDWQNDLHYMHYGPASSRIPEFSAREKEYLDSLIKEGKALTAIARGDLPPYSYVEKGVLKGILPDYFQRVMRAANIPFKFIVPQNEEDYRDKVESNAADVIFDKIGPVILEEENSHAGFATDPYMETGLAMVTRMDFNGPVRIVALSEKIPLELDPELLNNAEVRHYPTAEDATNAVRRGEADAAFMLPFTAQMLVNRDPANGLVYTMQNDNGINFRMYVDEDGDHELITVLKKAIKRLPTGTLNQIASNYISYNAGEMSLSHYLHANPEIMFFAGLAGVLGLSLIFFMWLRGRWNRRLLATTEHANQELEGQLAIVEALSRNYTNVLSINAHNGDTSIIKISDYGGVQKTQASADGKYYEQIVNAYIKQKVHPEDRKYVTEALNLANVRKQLALKEEYTGSYRIVDNGEVHYFQFTFVKPNESGNDDEDMILAGFRNIDDVIRREQKQKKVLAEALAQARYASAAKTAFLNNMSHDIRTPMNAIIGFTSLASSNLGNTQMVKRYLGKIMTSSNHLLSLINDVLDMSRIESGKVKIEEQEVHLPEILHDLRTLVQADVKSKQLDFYIDTFNVENETIFCDRLRLNQILLNILSNAMKYTNQGGTVSVRVIQLAEAKNGVAPFEFRIRDTGIGMSKEFLEHVFEPFEREHTTTVSGIQGTGLGLAITKNIVDMMGGRIDVESEPGVGSEFTVTFQFKVFDQNKIDRTLPELAGTKALVVNNDVKACGSLERMFSELGLQADCSADADEALERAKSAEERKMPYGVYLIDVSMPEMKGLELVKRLRGIIPPTVPIILLTAYDWTDLETEAKDAGVNAFCSKPVFLSELRDVLANPMVLGEDKEKTAAPEGQSFAGKRILLAEDNEMNQEIAQMILEDAGFKLDIVEDGQQAVDKMREMPEGTYDLILMDVQMPVMNGYEATRQIRKLEEPNKSSIPIIAMTANAFDEDREEAIHSGMNGYVPKPIDINKLMETLAQFLIKAA